MKHKIKIKQLILAVALPLAIGGLAAFLTKDSMCIFNAVRKPPLAPPDWLFPVVWTALYILMGVASYLVYTSDASSPRKDRALSFYAIGLGVNFLWPIIFFNLQMYLAAFLVLILLWLLIVICIVLFYYILDTAGKLLIPYLLWVSFAGYLNLGIYLMNR